MTAVLAVAAGAAFALAGSGAASAAVPVGQQTVQGSATSVGAEPSSSSVNGSVSDDGRFTVFISSAMNLPGSNGFSQAYLRDLQTGAVELVSSTPGMGTTGANGNSFTPVISGDGQFVAFLSSATNVVAGINTMNMTQVYIRDLQADATNLISHGFMMPNNGAADGAVAPIGIAEDGSRVSYRSLSQLTATAVSGTDMQAYVTTNNLTADTFLVSTTTGGASLSESVVDFSMSHDGTFVAFTTAATNVVAAPVASGTDAQAYTRGIEFLNALGGSVMISTSPDGMQEANESVNGVAVGDEGEVAYISAATNVVVTMPAILNNQVFYRSAPAAATRIVTHQHPSPAPIDPVAAVINVAISGDGQKVAYGSDSDELTVLGSNAKIQVYVWNAADLSNTAVSVTPTGALGNEGSASPYLTGDGGFVVFQSFSDNLVPNFSTSIARVQTYVRNLAALTPPVTPTPTPTGSSSAGGSGSGSGSGSASGGLASTGGAMDGVLPLTVGGSIVLLFAGAAAIVVLRRTRVRRSTND